MTDDRLEAELRSALGAARVNYDAARADDMIAVASAAPLLPEHRAWVAPVAAAAAVVLIGGGAGLLATHGSGSGSGGGTPAGGGGTGAAPSTPAVNPSVVRGRSIECTRIPANGTGNRVRCDVLPPRTIHCTQVRADGTQKPMRCTAVPVRITPVPGRILCLTPVPRSPDVSSVQACVARRPVRVTPSPTPTR